MKKIVISLVLLCIVVSCSARREDVIEDKIVRIETAGDIPIIKIKINGKELYAIMDTGASISVVDQNSSYDLGFSAYEDPRGEETAGYGGTTTMLLTDIRGIELDGEDLRGEFKAQDLSNIIYAIKSGTGYQIGAIVGMNFMRRYQFAFDFQDNTLTFNNY